MFKRKTILELLIEESQKNLLNQVKTEQNKANIEYIAIMNDIQLESEDEIYE